MEEPYCNVTEKQEHFWSVVISQRVLTWANEVRHKSYHSGYPVSTRWRQIPINLNMWLHYRDIKLHCWWHLPPTFMWTSNRLHSQKGNDACTNLIQVRISFNLSTVELQIWKCPLQPMKMSLYYLRFNRQWNETRAIKYWSPENDAYIYN